MYDFGQRPKFEIIHIQGGKMKLTATQFGHMVDGACITATMSFSSQVDLAEAAKKYGFKQVYERNVYRCWWRCRLFSGSWY